jgi:pimeloyl-ACP methyl ester carboxylesterase
MNVRDTWFSTATYFRRADFLIHQNWSNPDIITLWAEQTSAFNKAIAALPIPGERIRIPARKQNFTIEAIWYGASTSKTAKLPTLVVGNGFDAAQEDSYHSFCAPVVLRGWNCIMYEGPGRNTVRRCQDVGFIPQWEDVGTPVVDWLHENKAHIVDKDRLTILGNSFGSLLALRVAAFELRIKAVVAIDGIWDFYKSAIAPVPADLVPLFEAGKKQEFDSKLLELRATNQLSTMTAWGLDQGLWSFYTHSPFEFITQAKEYEVSDFVKKIKVPVFIGNGEFDAFVTGQPATLKQALGILGTLHDFNSTAGYHYQTGATQEMVRSFFAWLNKTFPKNVTHY